jgi:hypothetical protein
LSTATTEVDVGGEDEEKNEEEKRSETDVNAAQEIFGEGRGVAQEVDFGRRRSSEGAARDVFAEGGGR